MADTVAPPAHHNHVELTGRLSAVPVRRPMPSGDSALIWRLVVARSPRRDGQRNAFDVLECVSWAEAVHRAVDDWVPGDTVCVRGTLRRRFWRPAGQSLTSRVEVEVRWAQRVGAPRSGESDPAGQRPGKASKPVDR